ncbi:MAG TPA: hypothetical protein VJV79_06530 [Polyangiaceae bacterium]|nr:hypothetical protein [Polyangiaceae bacterium]
MISRFAYAIAMCALIGCRGEQRQAAPAPSSNPPAIAPHDHAPPAPSATSIAVSTFDETNARAFIERWLKAQNDHDFAAYSALYGTRFSGTKRVGSYSKRFDQGGWLRDRQPMFRDGVIVQISELKLSGTAGAVRAVFTQDFSAPGFRDRGQKELFLVAQPAGLAIAREEMLVSNLAEAAPVVESAVLAFHRDGPVVATGFTGALPGEPQLLARGGSDSFDVALPLAPAALSETTRAWLGKSITVYAKDGASCQGSVIRFDVRVKAEPHFGMRQAWAGEDGSKKASPREIAAQIWSIARDDERFAVAVLDHACQGVWAMSHAASFVAATAPAAPLRAAALNAFKALPAYRELQARFARESANPKQAWESVDGQLNVVELRSAPELALIVVSARGGVSCGSFSGNLSAIWKVIGADARASFTPRGVFKDSSDLLKVHGAVDQNADGSLELLAGPDVFADEISVLRLGANGYQRKALFSTSFWDCGC